MKKSFIIITLLSVFISCKKDDPIIDTQQTTNELTGRWVLKETFYGFTNRTIAGSGQDFMEFQANGNFVESYSKAIRNQGKYQIEKNPNADDSRQIVRYPDQKEYQYFWFDKAVLNLYQKAPDGAVLADGGIYRYEKLQ